VSLDGGLTLEKVNKAVATGSVCYEWWLTVIHVWRRTNADNAGASLWWFDGELDCEWPCLGVVGFSVVQD
jgi:hypothetical protein